MTPRSQAAEPVRTAAADRPPHRLHGGGAGRPGFLQYMGFLVLLQDSDLVTQVLTEGVRVLELLIELAVTHELR